MNSRFALLLPKPGNVSAMPRSHAGYVTETFLVPGYS